MKLTIRGAVIDVAFNPANKNDGRPDAGMSYTASLRVDSTDGSAKLTVGTDFTPPCVLAVLPEWSTALASSVLAELGLWAPAATEGWLVARDGVYAYTDGVRYGEAVDEELTFMASFGFTPGARFNLALPMLRAQRAELLARDAVTLTPESVAAAQLATEAAVNDAIAADPDAAIGLSPAQEQGRRAAQEAADNGTAGNAELSALAAAEVALPTREENVAAVAKTADAVVAAPKRRRKAAPKGSAVQAVTPADDVPAQQADAIADVFDALDAAPAVVDEVNPFAIEGL